MPKLSVEIRFWDSVNKKGPIHPTLKTRCWIWTACKTTNGYGQFHAIGEYRAHRVAHRLFLGDIPPTALVLHKCDNRVCVNPEHLFLGTPQDNSDDMIKKSRHTGPNNPATGDHHGTKTHPESILRGDRHWSMVHPDKIVKGENHGMAKLTEESIKYIRSKFIQGETTYKELGRMFGVTKAHIRDIIQRKCWKHL